MEGHSVLLSLLIIGVSDAVLQHTGVKRDTGGSFLPYLQLDDAAVPVLPKTSVDTDICSDPVEVPGGLPFGSIRTTKLSICENGVILTEPAALKSSLCVCRGEFATCEDSGESLYVIAPFWSNVNNVSATDGTSITYEVFVEGNSSHTELLNRVWSYISNAVMSDGVEFFPSWMLVAHWNNVHPYIRPNEVDPRNNTFQAVVVTDGTQMYAIFTYNCSDLGWARTPNSFVASDCSFIGAYSGRDFNAYLSETDLYGLQIDRQTANISRAASCSSQTTSWNNFLFVLTSQIVVNLTARAPQINAKLGGLVTMQFSISTYLMQAEDAVLDFQFIPHECQCSSPLLTFSFTCNNEEYQIEREGVEVLIHCSAARLNLTVANVTQQAFGDYIVLVSASETHGGAIAFTNLTMVDESVELLEKTSDPSSLTADDIASASEDLQQLEASALSDENVRQNYLKTIDNLMQADSESIVQSQRESNSSTKILDSLEQFTLQLELPENTTNETFIFESYGFQVFDINREMFDGTNISANLGPIDTVKNITIPVNISFSEDVDMDTTAYVRVSDTGINDEIYRLSVVAYRQENLFQNDTNGTGVIIVSAVMSVTSIDSNPTLIMGFRSLRNTTEEVSTEVEHMEICSNFNTGGNGGRGAWSDDSCEEVPCDSSATNFTCCECHTYGHFGLLLAVTPVVLDEHFETALVVFSYLGASVSIICLILLLTTYILSKKLRSSTSGKLLINLGISLLGIYIIFIVGGHIRPYGHTKVVDIICGISSSLLQYFMLVYFGWTVAEAFNLYFSLVKVFEVKIIRRYTLKAGLIVWLLPLAVVIVSAGAGHRYYINDVYCRPVEWPFYFAFVLPIALILIFDCVMFARIMASLYKHTKQSIQLKNDKQDRTLRQLKQHTRYAIVLVTLFGLGWIFGLFVTGYPGAPMAVTFTLQFLFCVFVSAQGFLLFLFHVVFSHDAKDFWRNQLGKCFPSIKVRESKTTTGGGGKKKSVVKKLTGLFRAPKPSAETTQSPDHNTISTMDRRGQTSSAITESFEASYQVSTLPRSGNNNALLTPTRAVSMDPGASTENLTSEMSTSRTLDNSQIDFDTLSLQDDF